MRTIFFCICAAFVLLQAGCAGGAGKPRIIADLYVRYLADVAELKAQASFYEGDSLQTALPKTMAGGVTFQQSAMEAKILQGEVVRYSLQRRGNFNPPFQFGYTDGEGVKGEYTLAMNPIDSFSFRGEASRSKGATLLFYGAPLGEGESLVILVSDVNNQAATLEISGPKSTNDLFIPASNLASLQPGPGTVYLVRKTAKMEDTPGRHVIATGEYYTDVVRFELAE